MLKNKQYYARRIHRFLGVFIGVQFIFWTISGLYFSWTDIDEIHGDHFRTEHIMHEYAKDLIDINKLDSTLMIATLELRFVNHKPYYWVNESILFDAETGSLHHGISEAEAKEIAQIYVKEDLQIKKMEYLTETGAHHEYRESALPVWAIHFEHPENLVAYVDAKSGQFTKVRHRAWRWFDFLWMFHTMDYAGRDNFNNLLLRIFSLAGLAAVGSGFTLFYMTKKKKFKPKK
ncbi:PepSY domain-containing protein [Algoriphagus sp. D3-2-R+10]|uniref:PepSY domain-containing protein n=1 Tax=Algoriphagus aurantiacus TaxID=3103948 RepID=UPI002B3FB1CB|nr:PepSY domain-containing protein [Algoriphagus sp. D3-2-R+10]MEB2775847.1 PepSY domain-containing protein [Algoriphagus sp. D3-2-R+10]